ncbi:MAG: tyrosine-type recombinase/integrase, partial [Rikenellaceae bacterium]
SPQNILERYITYIERERRYSPLTVRNYRADMESFFRWLETTPEEFDPTQVTHHTLRDWIVERSEGIERFETPIKSSSLNRELSTLRSFFRWALSQGIIDRNPAQSIPSLKQSRKLPTFIPASRMNTLNEQCCTIADDGDWIASRDALIIRLFYATGLRLSELISIDLCDFSNDMLSLKVRGKGGKERLIPIMETIRDEIQQYLSKIKAAEICISQNFPLFLTKRLTRLSRNMVYRIVRRDLGEAGVQGRKSPHVLRHTFATQLLNGGADMREIQELLGHTSLQATQLYTHNSIATLTKTYQGSHPRGRKQEAEREVREVREVREDDGIKNE